jgi:hypothetical protein
VSQIRFRAPHHLLISQPSVLVDDVSKTEPLEQFWEQFRSDHKQDAHNSKSNVPESSVQPGPSWRGHSRNRALSSLTAVLPTDQSLPPLHPALSIVKYIDTFGPLVFPLHREALLRKRILFIAPPPVRLTCEFGTSMIPLLQSYSS